MKVGPYIPRSLLPIKPILWTLAAFFVLIFSTYGASWEWDDGGSTSDWSDQNQAKYFQNWNPDTNPTTVGGETPWITFGNLVSSDQNITVKQGDKTVHKVFFDSSYQYTLGGQGNPSLIFDSGTLGGSSEINIASQGGSDPSHVIDVKIELNDDLIITHDASSNLTLNNEVELNTNNLTLKTEGKVYMDDSITGSGNITKEGSGVWFVQNSNTSYTGTTIVSEGNVVIEQPSGVGNLIIESGGTVILATDNAINTTADLELAGGTLNTGGYNQTLNTLTLSSSSTVILGGVSTERHSHITGEGHDHEGEHGHGDGQGHGYGHHYTNYSTLIFSDLDYATGSILTIDYYIWGENHVFFNSVVSNDFLQNVYWQDQDIMGAVQLASGEIIPIIVPEPATYLTGVAGMLLISFNYLRRKDFFGLFTKRE